MPVPTPTTLQGHNALLRTLATRPSDETAEIGKNAADFMEQLMEDVARMVRDLESKLEIVTGQKNDLGRQLEFANQRLWDAEVKLGLRKPRAAQPAV